MHPNVRKILREPLPPEPPPKPFWDRWIGNLDGEPVYWQKRLCGAFGWTLRLHKFVKADNAGCFHTHPARAFRLILWSGYREQVADGGVPVFFRAWRPGMIGYVAPELCHRIDSLSNGRVSYSLWLHGPKVASIELHGEGWPDELLRHAGKDRVRVSPPQQMHAEEKS